MGVSGGSNTPGGMRVGNSPLCGAFVGGVQVYSPPAVSLPAPTGVTIYSEQFGTITVYWSSPELPPGVSLVRYEVVLESRANANASWAVALTLPNVSASLLSIGGIIPAKQYRCKVRVFGSCNHTSPFSAYSATYDSPDGTLCAGGGCDPASETFDLPNGNFQNIGSLTLPAYNYSGGIPGWYCHNVDIIPKQLVDSSASPSEVCVHLKLCPRLGDQYGRVADSYIECTVDADEDTLHEFRVTQARHPSAEATRTIILEAEAYAAGELASPDPDKRLISCYSCIEAEGVVNETPCYGHFLFEGWGGFWLRGVAIPGVVGQLGWVGSYGAFKTKGGTGADKVRIRFRANGFKQEQYANLARLCANVNPLTCPSVEGAVGGDEATVAGPQFNFRALGTTCSDCSALEPTIDPFPCPYDPSNCNGVLVDCILPCRPDYVCRHHAGLQFPNLVPFTDAEYAEFGQESFAVRWKYRQSYPDGNSQNLPSKISTLCDTLQILVGDSGRGNAPYCNIAPPYRDARPPCGTTPAIDRYYFTERGAEVARYVCAGIRPPQNLLTHIVDFDLWQPPPQGYWWEYTSATIWKNRNRYAVVGPVRLSPAGEEVWFEDAPSDDGLCNLTGALTRRSRIPVMHYRAYNRPAADACCSMSCNGGDLINGGKGPGACAHDDGVFMWMHNNTGFTQWTDSSGYIYAQSQNWPSTYPSGDPESIRLLVCGNSFSERVIHPQNYPIKKIYNTWPPRSECGYRQDVVCVECDHAVVIDTVWVKPPEGYVYPPGVDGSTFWWKQSRIAVYRFNCTNPNPVLENVTESWVSINCRFAGYDRDPNDPCPPAAGCADGARVKYNWSTNGIEPDADSQTGGFIELPEVPHEIMGSCPVPWPQWPTEPFLCGENLQTKCPWGESPP